MLVSAPASVGDVLDRITILRIKEREIADPEKRANVARELGELLALADRHGLRDPGLEAELEAVNATLWRIEDELRLLERDQEFSDRFVRLARDVYFTNDRRAEIKRRINLRFGSALIEEKHYVPYAGSAPAAPGAARGLDRLDYSHIHLTMVASYYFQRAGDGSLVELLQEYASLPSDLLDRLQFVLVDDGSPVAVDVPRDLDLNLLLLRINADIPWNWAGGRNLGAVCARSDKILFTDIDHRFPEATLRRLLSMGDPGRSLYRFHRRRPDGEPLGVPTNIHCMSRGRFLKLFGYDEDLCGHYGSDPMFFQWQKLHGTRLRRLPARYPCFLRERHVEDPGHSLDRDSTRSLEIRRRNMERIRRFGEGSGHSRSFLCFPWEVTADLHRRNTPPPPREDRGWARRWWFRWLFGRG
jgi:hypothetical protein